MKLRALVIGCGNIAGRFDMVRSREELPLTHAGAYSHDGRFQIAACVEPDEARREEFMRHWRTDRSFSSISDAIRAADRYDVVSICSPTSSHAEDLRSALAFNPKLVFCEKPLTPSADETAAAVGRYRESKVLLAVNYTRRWDPAVVDLKAGLDERRWGALRSVVACYNKGLLNNGSHLLDILLFLFGRLHVKTVGSMFEDYSAGDPTMPFSLETDTGIPVQVTCGHAADFAFFEMQLVCEKAVIAMEEAGMAWRERRPVDSRMFKGYRVLGDERRRAGDYPKAMLRSVGNVFEAIQDGFPLASTGDSALATQRLCEEILHK